MPKLLNIVKHPNESLRKVSDDLDLSSISQGEFRALLKDMAYTMIKCDGVGLAAPQIGLSKRLIVINSDDGPVFLLNPRLTKKSFAKNSDMEGCLSVPNVFGKVKRHKKVSCLFYDLEGKAHKIEASGFLARVLQHEIDHLDGVLFIDHASDLRGPDTVDSNNTKEVR